MAPALPGAMDLPGLHHPLFQSVILPLLLSLLGIGVLRASAGPVRAGAGVGAAVLASTVWLMGWTTPPGSALQKLPWLFAAAWLAGIALDTGPARRLRVWLCLGAGWIAASWWLGSSSVGVALALAAGGLLVIAWLLQAPPDRADGVAVAVVASLGLAGVCFAAGSLALFQLALLLAAAVGGAGLWLWPKPRVRIGAAMVAVAGVAWLAIAQAALLLIQIRPQSLALLALGFAAAPLLARQWRRSSAIASPVAAAVAAALLAGAAVALQAGAGGTGGMPSGEGRGDDSYYGK